MNKHIAGSADDIVASILRDIHRTEERFGAETGRTHIGRLARQENEFVVGRKIHYPQILG